MALLCRSHLLSLYCRSPLRPTARDDSESLAERFSGRVAPFSGSDQVSAVVKLSLLGRKTSKHEPVKAAHPLSACIWSRSHFFFSKKFDYSFFVFSSNFTRIEEILIEGLSAVRIQQHEWSSKSPQLYFRPGSHSYFCCVLL